MDRSRQGNRRHVMTFAGALTVAAVALVGCGSDGDDAAETTTTAAETTTTAAETTTTAAETTTTAAAAEEAPAEAAAPLRYPEDGTQWIEADKLEVTAGDTVTITAGGFAPGAMLATNVGKSWPPTGLESIHMETYVPDVGQADADGNATMTMTVDPLCGTTPECYLIIGDGIGPNGIYAAVKVTYKG